LWAGRLPLHDVVWTWAVLRGALFNVGCTMISMWIWLVHPTGPIAAAAMVLHFLPVPYNVIFAVGGWRSAAAPQHSRHARVLARVLVVALATLFMII
jgi:hypothetical protein